MSTTYERVKKVLVDRLKVSDDEVTETASFVDDLGADSLDVVDLVMGLEEEFDIEICRMRMLRRFKRSNKP